MLRHITKKKYISSIITDHHLKGSDNLRKRHRGFVSFENFNSDCDRTIFLGAVAEAKKIKPEDMIELFFDEIKMREDGIEIRKTFHDGIGDSKIELRSYVSSDTDMESIGDYRYVYGSVSLDYLTEESREELFGGQASKKRLR